MATNKTPKSIAKEDKQLEVIANKLADESKKRWWVKNKHRFIK